ncbi:MAG: hypothetical protein JRF02_07495 [Deltaproteobacteria bacterium]|jgi:uncharacterized membrane protein YvbJ|nr:hypothetical protein [Deltaproteobacteria bacterium]
MMTGEQENNICPKCGYIREPDTTECPKCGIIFAQIKPEYRTEEVEKEQEDNLAEISKPDIAGIKLDPSLGSKRNILYNLNTRAINLFLFVITAIIAGLLVFKYIMVLISSSSE